MKKVYMQVFLLGLALLTLLGLVLLVFGTRAPTQQERDNRKALEAILTAITLKNRRLVEESDKQTKARYDAGQLTDEEYQGMKVFLDKARAGDWSGAERDGYAFRKKHPFVQDGH